jgi:hypothetical protein
VLDADTTQIGNWVTLLDFATGYVLWKVASQESRLFDSGFHQESFESSDHEIRLNREEPETSLQIAG